MLRSNAPRFVPLLALVALACGGETPPVVYAPDSHGVTDVLDRMHQAAASADEEAYFGCYSEDSIFMGTDATERWTKAEFRAFAAPFFARGDAWAFRAIRRDIMFSADGTLAWFDEDLETNALGPARGSGVVRRRDERTWEVVHYNLALTIPNERFAEVRALLTGVADTTHEVDEPASGVTEEE